MELLPCSCPLVIGVLSCGRCEQLVDAGHVRLLDPDRGRHPGLVKVGFLAAAGRRAALVGSDGRMQGEGTCLGDGIEVPSIGSRDVAVAESLLANDVGRVRPR
jgi:hypothetical protein